MENVKKGCLIGVGIWVGLILVYFAISTVAYWFITSGGLSELLTTR